MRGVAALRVSLGRRAGLLAGLVLVVATAAACGTVDPPAVAATPEPVASPPVGTTVGPWTRLPDPPLAARHDALAVWTGDEVVVLGGSITPPCPGNALCASGLDRIDGAAYDPVAGTWRRIADAPAAVTANAAVVLDGDLYVLESGAGGDGSQMLRYDPEADVWTVLPGPSTTQGRRLLAWGDQLVAVMESAPTPPTPPTTAHEIWDPATATWTPLPPDPMPAEWYRFGFTVGPDLYVSTIDTLARFDGSAWALVQVGDDGATCDDLRATRGPSAPDTVLMPRGPDSPAFCVRDDDALAGVEAPPSYDAATRIIEFPLGGDERAALGTSVYDAAATAWMSLDAPNTLQREGMAAVWAGDELFTFGGAARTDTFDTPVYGDAWLWTAPG
ncbi:MAG: hypothetical protein JNK12_05720 [Acidimicrobiales bacterium]|nr:hypothetical protein [Acidimicrobiales bacterium]